MMASPARNPVRSYPCGILEQAYRELVAEGHSVTKQAPSAISSEQDTAAAGRPLLGL
jgi:hypothetical protein